MERTDHFWVKMPANTFHMGRYNHLKSKMINSPNTSVAKTAHVVFLQHERPGTLANYLEFPHFSLFTKIGNRQFKTGFGP